MPDKFEMTEEQKEQLRQARSEQPEIKVETVEAKVTPMLAPRLAAKRAAKRANPKRAAKRANPKRAI